MSLAITRRGLARAALLAGVGLPTFARASAGTRIVVIGGGFGGATAARFLKRLLPELNVTLVEAGEHYVACPFSNLVLAGRREIEAQTFRYDALRAEGIDVRRDLAVDIDAEARSVRLQSGQPVLYDKLILSPGIRFRRDALPGYDNAAEQAMPHAWKAGPQTVLLAQQLQAMKDGGTVVISVPAAPFRCPPGPYERASLIASYLKQHKPRSRIVILDGNERFSKQALFEQEWQSRYPGMIEWRSASNDGVTRRVDAPSRIVETDFEVIKGDVCNIIPPQQAADIAERAGVTDSTGWCPIDATSFASVNQPDIHVIGDATIAAPVPKSAFAANAQAKVCSLQIARLLTGFAPEATLLANTCYSFVANDAAISIADVYDTSGGRFVSVEGAGGVSPLEAEGELRRREASHARDWFAAITPRLSGEALRCSGVFDCFQQLRKSKRATPDAWPQPLTDTPVTAAQGQSVFVGRELGHCVLCHSVDGLDAAFQGDLGPPLDDVGTRLSAAQIRARIIDASMLNAATIMPPYYRTQGLHRVAVEHVDEPVLTALQIEQLVLYLTTLEGPE